MRKLDRYEKNNINEATISLIDAISYLYNAKGSSKNNDLDLAISIAIDKLKGLEEDLNALYKEFK